jgi:hypothetical protein
MKVLYKDSVNNTYNGTDIMKIFYDEDAEQNTNLNIP